MWGCPVARPRACRRAGLPQCHQSGPPTHSLRAFLDGKASLTEAEAVSHQQCAFGKWYYSDGLKNFGHIKELRDVEEPHAELHRTIKEIVKAQNAGDKPTAERLYAGVEDILRRIVALLDAAEANAA